MAWKELTGRPNCTRRFAYSSADSRSFSAPPDHLVRQHGRGLRQGLGERASGFVGCTEQFRLDVGELEARKPAGGVQGLQRRARQPGGIVAHSEQRKPCLVGAARTASEHDEQVGRVAIEDKALHAGEAVAAFRLARDGGKPPRVPSPVGLGERQSGERLAGDETRQQRLLLILVSAVQDRAGRQYGGAEEWGAQKSAPHLLEDDAELDKSKAHTAVSLRHMDAAEPKLIIEISPIRRVPARFGFHQLADDRRGRGLPEEAA
jgi:hypothetical protein